MSDVWLTPPPLLAALGGANAFGFDPCACEDRPWDTAQDHKTWRENGLRMKWDPALRAWCNPPYSDIRPWIGRMAAHGYGTALIFAKTDTQAFMTILDTATSLFWVQGRLRFFMPNGQPARDRAKSPAVLCAWGMEDTDYLAELNMPGRFQPLRIPQSLAILALRPSWREALTEWIKEQRGPVSLADLYTAFSRHPKSRGNRHYRAKVRQTLARGGFRRQGDLWSLAA